MEKKEYVSPEIVEHGDVKEITLAGSATITTIDNIFTQDGVVYAEFAAS